jgi:histidinol dehydrogenase
MKIINYPERGTWKALCTRPEMKGNDVSSIVHEVFQAVFEKGIDAVKEYSKRYDNVELTDIEVSAAEFEKADLQVSQTLKKAILNAYNNISKFHSSQAIPELIVETQPGVLCRRKSVPIQTVGLYIPGGTAPLFSTVLMLGIPAMLAGCREIVICTPPRTNGTVHPAILYAAKVCGIGKVFKVGGIQAIAALTFGADKIPVCNKIFGPGNGYVTAAKQFAQTRGVAIDMPAGPSEVLVIAGQNANPEFVAADLLSQAEHGVDSQVILVCTGKEMADKCMDAVNVMVGTLPRKEIAERSLKNSLCIVLKNEEEAIDFSNIYAPEHLIIQANDATRLCEKVTAAGSVFLGNYTPESAGDYASGTNHTLPTNGFARSYSGVSLDSFLNKITIQEITQNGIKLLGETIITMAEAEELHAHALAVKVRLETINKEKQQ